MGRRGRDPTPRPARRGGCGSWPAKVGLDGRNEKLAKKLFQITRRWWMPGSPAIEPGVGSFRPSCSFYTSSAAASPDQKFRPAPKMLGDGRNPAPLLCCRLRPGPAQKNVVAAGARDVFCRDRQSHMIIRAVRSR